MGDAVRLLAEALRTAMLGKAKALALDTVRGFIADEAMSRGAAIAYYTLFSVAPLLVIATAIAGTVFGEEAARGAVSSQLRDLLGLPAAEAIEGMIVRDTTATATVVSPTATTTKAATGAQLSLRSRGDVSYAASSSTGARSFLAIEPSARTISGNCALLSLPFRE